MTGFTLNYLEGSNELVEAARIAWAAILIKPRQLISFDGAGFGIFVACAKWR
jgi:hypothetical protein